MTKADTLQRIRDTGVIAVVRAASADGALRMIEAIRAGGLTVVEVTLTVPDAPQLIARLARERDDLLVGAGSVADGAAAGACIEAGARFVVSPVLDPAVLAQCRVHEVVAMPGALTPTEIVAAWRAGADLVKVFPADAVGGASYIRSVKAPLPEIELVPTGGVSLANAASFIEAGAAAVGVGGELTRGPAERIALTARAFLGSVRSARRAA